MPKVRVTGGEPFIRRDLADLVSSLLRLNHIDEVAVYTNGYFTDRVVNGVERILTACSSKKRLEIGISLDGMREKHDEIRGRQGAFDKACATLEGLRKLKQRFPNLSIHSGSVIQPENLEHIAQIDEFRREIGVESHHMLVVNSSYLGNVDHEYGPKTFSEGQKCKIRSLLQDKPESIGLDKYLASGKRPMPCFAGSASAFIARNGDLYPCTAMPYEPVFLMGNVADGNFDEVWTSARAWEVRRRARLCTFPSCWSGCEITAIRTQYFPLELAVRSASLGFLDYYRLRGLR
jgi:radical SAM protein with 4Fe4S-binding SPASM domain